jgi:hypothetical protein
MISTVCPNGHASEANDYCDHCGARLGTLTSGPNGERDDDSHVVDVGPIADREPGPCPKCGVMQFEDDPFCENCGYRFGTEDVVVADEPKTPHWEVEITADRDQFDRVAQADLAFPVDQPSRVVTLSDPEIRIGRRSETVGAPQQVDCSIAPEDPGVSHLHAVLVRDDAGSYAIRDLGSMNGTTINDDPTPIAPDALVPLAEGDRVHVGAWTMLTMRVTASPAD